MFDHGENYINRTHRAKPCKDGSKINFAQGGLIADVVNEGEESV